jgi:hypothetical protein
MTAAAPSGVATLLTDVEGSTRRWEADAEAMLDPLIEVAGGAGGTIAAAVTGSSAHAQAVTAVGRARGGGGVTRTRGSGGRTHSTAGTGQHRAHR